jgi:hypothetical protein
MRHIDHAQLTLAIVIDPSGHRGVSLIVTVDQVETLDPL